ncbi:hypothetical protein L950_0223055 [Sphingobacterium sp. IITKGP-BTPF85]|nr:hypothetical protein L950_0223055 [Sphingobacterium sp. IITKGP-BTPF85]
MQAASDPHGRVRLEVLTAASWMPREKGMPIMLAIAKRVLMIGSNLPIQWLLLI